MKFVLKLVRFYLLLFIFVGCAVSADQYGYGLIGINNPVFSIGNSTFAREIFFRDLKKRAESKRKVLLSQEADDLSLDSAKTNISCFAFEFFDEGGGSLSNGPIHYGHNFIHDAQNSNKDYIYFLRDRPFYFISGRHEEKFLCSDMMYLEPFLGEAETDGTRSSYLEMKELCKQLKDFKSKALMMSQKVGIDREVAEHLLAGPNIFVKSLKAQLIEKIPESEKMWFKSIINRSRSCGAVPSCAYNKTLLCRGDDAELCILTEQKDFIPGVKATTESIFVHSEQIALAHMYSNGLKIFFEYLKNKNVFDKEKVKYIVIYEYTYNTSCKRCARSILYDFAQNHDFKPNLKSIINEFFLPGVNMRFMLGASREYENTARRLYEPNSPGVGPNDFIYTGINPIPFDDEIETNQYLYQWLISDGSFNIPLLDQRFLISSTKKFGVINLR